MTRRKRIILQSTLVFLLAATVFVGWQVWTPSEVPWQAATVAGLAASRADGLVLQQERGDEVWAAEGFSIYRSQAGGAFAKVASVAWEPGEQWMGHLRLVRQLTGRVSLTDVVPLKGDIVLAFAGGRIYRLDLAAGTSEAVHALRHYGRGVGRGVMAHGIALDDAGRVYYGEYFRNAAKGDVRLYRSDDDGRTWPVAHEFPAGEIRHIHAVQWDPVAKCLWLAAGDSNEECRIGYSTDQGVNFKWIAKGDQKARACGLVFLPGAVMWSTDTGENRLIKWTREGGKVEEVGELPSATYHAQTLDERHGLVGLAERTATAWLCDASGAMRKVMDCGSPAGWESQGDPPRIRLARGHVPECRWVYLNPVRTIETPETIFRFEKDAFLKAFPLNEPQRKNDQ